MKVMQSDNALICIMDLTKWKKKGRGVYLPRCRNEYHGILAYNYSDNFLEDLFQRRYIIHHVPTNRKVSFV